jgi:hypothetical protein
MTTVFDKLQKTKNKKMKKRLTVITLAVVLLGLNTANAQDRQGGDPAARKAAMIQRLKDELKLTDVQADSVATISQEFQPKMREVFMDQSLSQEDRKAKLDPIIEARNKRIQANLGDDLFKKYLEWQEKMRQQRGAGGGRGNQ